MKEEPEEEVVLTAEGAARLLHVSVKTLLALARAGELRGRKVGREWRFVREDLLSYVRTGAPAS
jgi:excisionase family DNA binding protein